jgi:ABC-type multidrug transport system ATPase subunit
VAFAEALAHRPDLLVLDEPTSGVDPLARASLWDTVRDTADAGAGVLVTTHFMWEAEQCDRLVVMADGLVVAQGTVAEIVGEARVTVVESDAWASALDALVRAGISAMLVGRTLRVADQRPAAVKAALSDLPAGVREQPATLEERLFQLTLDSPGARAVA